MNPKKLLKDLERALKQDPENLVLRLKVAAALREVGRRDEAVAMYRSVAVAYHKQGRLAQAIAVCRSVLEIEPSQRETQALLAELDVARQNKEASAPFAEAAPPTGQTPRPRRTSAPPPPIVGAPRANTPVQSLPSLPRLQPAVPRDPGRVTMPPPLPPASASGITPLPLPSIGQITPLPDEELMSRPRLPLPAQPSGQMPVQTPPPAPPPPVPTPLPRGFSEPPIGSLADEHTPRTPRRDAPTEARTPSPSPHMTVPGRPLRPTAAPLPGAMTQPPLSTPAPQRANVPVDTPPQRPRAFSGLSPNDAIAQGTPPLPRESPAGASSPPGPLPRGGHTLPPPPPGRKPAPPPLPPSVSSSPGSGRTPAGSQPQAPRGRRKQPTTGSALTPVSTPLPPPMPHTPTPPPGAGPLSMFPPPYVPVPGQDDEGNTLPTIRPRVVPAPAPGTTPAPVLRPRQRVPETAGADEMTRLADEPGDLAEVDEDRSTRVSGSYEIGDDEERLPAGDEEDNATRVAPEPHDEGPILVEPEVRLPADLERYSRRDRLLDVKWPEVVTDQDAGGGDVEEDTDPGAGDHTNTSRTDRSAPRATSTGASLTPGPTPTPTTPTPTPVVTGASSPAAQRQGGQKTTLPRVRPSPVAAVSEDASTGRVERLDPAEIEAEPDIDGGGGATEIRDSRLGVGGRTSHANLDAVPEHADDTGATTGVELRDRDDLGDDFDESDAVEDEDEDDTGGVEADDNLELAHAFDRGFGPDLTELAPDGSAIEQPLPLFARLSREAMAELQRRMSFRRCAAGDIILREGDPGDACYVIHSGSVRVLKRDPSGSSTDVIEIARLGAGALFGEFALLADKRRHASVQALEASELYEIPRRLLRELAVEYADVGPALERFYRERLLSTLLATAPFFQPLPEEQRATLMKRFVPRRVDPGATIIREGESGGGLYLIVLGQVDITRRAGDRRVVLLATLGEGAYFGEMSLLSGGRASATVTAAGAVELAQLEPRDFYDIVSAYPVIWDELRREASRRELVNQNILAGDTRLI